VIGAALRSAPGYLVAGLSGRQFYVDHVNDFPVPITSNDQSTGGLQAASGTRRVTKRMSSGQGSSLALSG